MYKIKQSPEDFIVKEISNVKLLDKGVYSIYSLKKRNYTTEKAVQMIADKLRLKRKFIGYAGNKDKIAVTEQLISIKTNRKITIKSKDIKLKFLGYSDKPISLGDLIGNKFIINIKINEKEINNLSKLKKKKIIIPNYFGEQRFSKNNIKIGELILKKDFKGAVGVIIKNDIDFKKMINNYLKNNKNDYIGALRLVPKKILKLYIHSVQSYIFNNTIDKIINNKIKNIKKLPIVGFGTEIENKNLRQIVGNILKKEKINLRDFIIRELPELTVEGSERDLYMLVEDLKILEKSKDKIRLNFKLKKGSYATVAVKYLFG